MRGSIYALSVAAARSADCGAGLICDLRLGETVSGSRGILFPAVGGGACVASCNGQSSDYCQSQFPQTPVCNPETGYCVPCVQDSDCTANASQPLSTPSCVDYPNGEPAPWLYPSFATGGGRCGCRATSDCDDGRTCQDPSDAGECVPPCTYVEGVDSCIFSFDSYDLFCNTFTGLCQECLDSYDCTGFGAPICSQGTCVECMNASQCPADRPGCGFGTCGDCNTVADCPADGGFTCATYDESDAHTRCLLPCVAGDDAGLGTVSDAGPPCPAASPFCTTSDQGQSWCSECRYEQGDCADNYNCCGNFCGGYGGLCP